jgi:isocitrate dehydrogenase kinase/phosphatase
MGKNLTDSRLANLCAEMILETFDGYHDRFKEITRRARSRFEDCDWLGGQSDSAERLSVYRNLLEPLVQEMREYLQDRLYDRIMWASIKAVYSAFIRNRDDWELAETYFNSVTRRIFTTIGLDPQIEFVDSDLDILPACHDEKIYQIYASKGNLFDLMLQILYGYSFEVGYRDKRGDAQRAAAKLEEYLHSQGIYQRVDRVEMVKPVFFRNKGAYLVGRFYCGETVYPLALALLNSGQGVMVDAVLVDTEDIHVLFSFTRAYFMVDIDRPYELVHFLRTIMPRKRIAEIYTSIGYNKHGKTEFYRDLLCHLDESEDLFEIAQGDRGMVMIVFTLPSYDVVFKIIKDRFDPPKQTTRREVMQQYRRVFQHDRAGRLPDAQEFEHLKFSLNRVSKNLLDELKKNASQSIEITEEYLIIKHAYVERRVTPLNLFLRVAAENEARSAVLEFGNAIKDMASTNIFPGDMFLKNFGVTRHGRVVFYDYDEVSSILECSFKKMPEAKSLKEELWGENTYLAVSPNDVFPEEFEYFLGLQGKLRQVFMEKHSEIFKADYWQQIQVRLKVGEVFDIYPYDQNRRLHNQVVA